MARTAQVGVLVGAGAGAAAVPAVVAAVALQLARHAAPRALQRVRAAQRAARRAARVARPARAARRLVRPVAAVRVPVAVQALPHSVTTQYLLVWDTVCVPSVDYICYLVFYTLYRYWTIMLEPLNTLLKYYSESILSKHSAYKRRSNSLQVVDT